MRKAISTTMREAIMLAGVPLSVLLLAMVLNNAIQPAADPAPDIICATVIVIIGSDPLSQPADQMLRDIRTAWRHHDDGGMMTDETLARTMLACVASPSSTLHDVFITMSP
jgi:hypothetical protein